MLAFEIAVLLRISNNIPWGGMDIFWNQILTVYHAIYKNLGKSGCGMVNVRETGTNCVVMGEPYGSYMSCRPYI